MASIATVPPILLSGVPVHQPPHLEGDSSLATEILPGPPSLVSIQQSTLKRDPRKPSTAFSYLPPSDPGSTYSGIMHGTLIGHDPDASRLKRSKAATGRAQRASARNQNGAMSAVDPSADSEAHSTSTLNQISGDFEPYTMVIDDELSISRSNSSHNLQEGTSTAVGGRPRRKDKGKGKEVDSSTVRVKEEPKQIFLHTPEPPLSNLLNNEDHCSSCRSYGALVYCDGCPRAFHLWCLNPPIESVDEGDSRWFCPSCMIRKHPPRKPPPSLLSSLIHQVDISIPTEFQLPDDVRMFFKDVGTGPKGTYVDTSEIKPPRLNRHGQLEDRDPHRLRDRNGAPVLCFRCGTSALPGGLAAAAPAAKRARRSSTLSKTAATEAWKSIVSCDYCNLHWHLDCLDPPMSTIPPLTKKWMCPNHAEQILPPKRRVPKQNAPPIEITKPRQFNNGNIEIIHPETSRTSENAPKVAVDEVLINGRRYRVPERVIVLDFWNKLNKLDDHTEKDPHLASGMSSPLTSLSSLDDLDEPSLPEFSLSHEMDDLKAAQMLCGLHNAKIGNTVSSFNGGKRRRMDSGVQTDAEQIAPARSRVVKLPRVASAPKASAVNGSARTHTKLQSNAIATHSEFSSTAKRKKTTQPVPPPEPSTRELRSRSKNHIESSLTSISSRSSMKRADDSGRESIPFDGPMSAPLFPVSTGKSRSFHVKVEETDNGHVLGNSSTWEAGPSSHTPAKPRKVLGRPRGSPPASNRRVTRKEPANKSEVKEKRGRKRKEREDELPETDGRDFAEAAEKSEKEKVERKPKEKRKAIRTPSRPGPTSPIIATPVSAAPSGHAPATPSLKIRLPRMNNATISHATSLPNANGETPTRL
ncbi:Uncharacterized protein C2F7.07c [Hypsizygus marmoreus]|uniref:Uncharacterized protein C2F7.07c n=1 Tax=Hypsizygus marmoreus TaxID=39966 RepID=A0A369JH28_HYPMA|nr:Uncharacterized protein C2F7.07c [Hypsizygus marmoreus]